MEDRESDLEGGRYQPDYVDAENEDVQPIYNCADLNPKVGVLA